jgi:hypothetical protein
MTVETVGREEEHALDIEMPQLLKKRDNYKYLHGTTVIISFNFSGSLPVVITNARLTNFL